MISSSVQISRATRSSTTPCLRKSLTPSTPCTTPWLPTTFPFCPLGAGAIGALVPADWKEVIDMADSKAEYPAPDCLAPAAIKAKTDKATSVARQDLPVAEAVGNVRRCVYCLGGMFFTVFLSDSAPRAGAPSVSWAACAFAWTWCSCWCAAPAVSPATRLWSARSR